MNVFQELAARNLPCELCGSPTIALYGGGWDNDRIYCTDMRLGNQAVITDGYVDEATMRPTERPRTSA